MLLSEARTQFPVTRKWVYLNHAAVSPLATPTRTAMEEWVAELNIEGAERWQHWVNQMSQVRETMARLVGAAAGEVTLTKNTSEGLSYVAQGLEWRSEDRVVTFACEFPANLYPWLALRQRGVQVDVLAEAALVDLEQVRKACRGARLLAISFVQYLSGFRSDLDAIGAICRETGTLLVVDAIQGLGAFPVDVKRSRVHALAADSHKWMMGPEGAGFLYLAPELLEQITPREIGWTSVENWADFNALDCAAKSTGPLAWRDGAARLECGTLNVVGSLGMGAAVGLLLEVGIATIAEHVLQLGAKLGAGLRGMGAELYQLSPENKHRSGITSFRLPGMDALAMVKRLEGARIQCAARNGWLRISPHVYNTAEEIEQLLGQLAS